MINHFVIILLYIVLCLAVALFGRRRKWGFWGYLWSSVLFTPLLGLLFLLASDPKKST
ncbi:uncharacterized protein sS8_1932 [Methylocaldum marinum]|uniref:Uncharacterized protein n=1 Tax=Methylocaldum marinum TaxID=1432792 RepID=A0A250KQT2_9GAMM|nr:hypothetical protein [Methylocaldum marinum]BBA33886.1 uncharacterized protein sS8_1932 [Methylocaldum marinum]